MATFTSILNVTVVIVLIATWPTVTPAARVVIGVLATLSVMNLLW